MERSTKHEAKLILTWLISVHGCDQAPILVCRSWFLRLAVRSGPLGCEVSYRNMVYWNRHTSSH